MKDPRLTSLAWAAYDAIYKWKFSSGQADLDTVTAKEKEEEGNAKGRVRMEQKRTAKA